jgi:hypothetical protein
MAIYCVTGRCNVELDKIREVANVAAKWLSGSLEHAILLFGSMFSHLTPLKITKTWIRSILLLNRLQLAAVQSLEMRQ